MLTQGDLIGKIVDNLAPLRYALDIRGKQGLFDLNTYCENFVRDLMNIIYGYSLVNLNGEHLNEPGLDLGDEYNRIGVQVTTVKTTDKINHTLEKITVVQKNKYDKFLIVILGQKQKSYRSINGQLADKLRFTEKDILDLDDLVRDIVPLPVDKIKEVYDYLEKSLIKVYGELGFDSTPTGKNVSILPSVERVSDTAFINCNKIALVYKEKEGKEMDPNDMRDINEASRELFEVLKRLPRITREFYYTVAGWSKYNHTMSTYYVRNETIKRVIKIPEETYYEEISLLEEAGILSYEVLEDYHSELALDGYSTEAGCLHYIIEAAKHLKLPLEEILVDLKFVLLATDVKL
ncbi:SMEK domain-containing protein [Bacillus sp. Brlt_9]|uniref:SMEK domain-containing protein n=1 Tax=Bacillus sp. Brlt_9 TaxID=3110916 RepID=UPI003F7C0C21